jgi:mannose-6-phosphate isomerase-like protein (cupin superfamily)
MIHMFDEAWPTWEIHPHGDEFVYLFEGDTDMVLKTGDGEVTLRLDTPGAYVVVPNGTWHTARPYAPTRMLFVTPGEGTLNQELPD